MFLAVHDEVECVVAAHDSEELAYDATKAVVLPSLSLHNFSLYFSAQYYGFTKLV